MRWPAHHWDTDIMSLMTTRNSPAGQSQPLDQRCETCLIGDKSPTEHHTWTGPAGA